METGYFSKKQSGSIIYSMCTVGQHRVNVPFHPAKDIDFDNRQIFCTDRKQVILDILLSTSYLVIEVFFSMIII